jgi:hypothetical protein
MVAAQSDNMVSSGIVIDGLGCLHSGNEGIQDFFRLYEDVSVWVCDHVENISRMLTMAQ